MESPFISLFLNCLNFGIFTNKLRGNPLKTEFMRSTTFSAFVFAVIFISWTGCNRTIDPVFPFTEHVYPLDDGKQMVYYVVDTIYETVQNSPEERRYYKKEVYDGQEMDLLGREVQKIFIYISPDSTDTLGNTLYNYQYDDLWTAYKNDEFAERIEGNIRYLVLKWPAQTGYTWNGNRYNGYGTQTYTYLNADTTVVVNGVTYEHSVYVLQVPFRQSGNPAGYFVEEYAYEIYAPYVGRIERFYKYYEQQSPTDVKAEVSRVFHEILVSQF